MMRLQKQLRALAERRPGPFSPHWVDDARRLMAQAAHALDAAEEVMAERPTRLIRPTDGNISHHRKDKP